MTAGLLIKNDVGTVQIDELYSNLALIAKGNMPITLRSYTRSNQAGRNFEASISVTGINPILAIIPSHNTLLISRVQSGSTFTFRIFSFTANKTDVPVVSYYVFDQCSLIPTGNAGLVVRNAAGVITYHNNVKPMNIVDFVSGYLYIDSDGDGAVDDPLPPTSTTYSYGRTYAVIPTIVGVVFAFLPVSQTVYSIFVNGRWTVVSGNIVTTQFGQMPYGDGSPGPGPTNQQSTYLVVDVTGY